MPRIELNITELRALDYVISKEIKVCKNVSRCKTLIKIQNQMYRNVNNTNLDIDVKRRISEEK